MTPHDHPRPPRSSPAPPRGLGRALAASSPSAAGGSSSTPGTPSGWPPPSPRPAPGAVTAVPGDVADPAHRAALADGRRAGGLDLLVNNASELGPSPLPPLADLAAGRLPRVLEVNAVAPLALRAGGPPGAAPRRRRVVDISSDAAVEAYEGWGGYGASKAALDQLTRRARRGEPGPARLRRRPRRHGHRHAPAAFPGEDISDRPTPETVVPGAAAPGRRATCPAGATARPTCAARRSAAPMTADVRPARRPPRPPRRRSGAACRATRCGCWSSAPAASRHAAVPRPPRAARARRPVVVNTSATLPARARGSTGGRRDRCRCTCRPCWTTATGSSSCAGRQRRARPRRRAAATRARAARRSPGAGWSTAYPTPAGPSRLWRARADPPAPTCRLPARARAADRRTRYLRRRFPLADLPDRLRQRAGQRGDGQRRPAVHRRAARRPHGPRDHRRAGRPARRRLQPRAARAAAARAVRGARRTPPGWSQRPRGPAGGWSRWARPSPGRWRPRRATTAGARRARAGPTLVLGPDRPARVVTGLVTGLHEPAGQPPAAAGGGRRPGPGRCRLRPRPSRSATSGTSSATRCCSCPDQNQRAACTSRACRSAGGRRGQDVHREPDGSSSIRQQDARRVKRAPATSS